MAGNYSESGQTGEFEGTPTHELNEDLLQRVRGPVESFDEWREHRPLLGAGTLMVAGLIIAYVPLIISSELLFVGKAYTVIGLLFATGVFVSGVGALLEPTHARVFGLTGIAFSMLSIFGALGGFLIGLLAGIVGGNLCLAWESTDDDDGLSDVVVDGAPDPEPDDDVNFRIVE